MKILKKSVPLWIVVIMLLSVSAVLADILLTKQISNTMRINGAASFKLVREDDNNVEVTSIAWGDFSPEQTKTSQTILSTRICIKNIGNIPLVVAWNATGLNRSDWSITATTAGNPYPENDYNQFRIDPGLLNGYIILTLTLTNPLASPADLSFTLNFNAQLAP